jgi:hypothetical protein
MDSASNITWSRLDNENELSLGRAVPDEARGKTSFAEYVCALPQGAWSIGPTDYAAFTDIPLDWIGGTMSFFVWGYPNIRFVTLLNNQATLQAYFGRFSLVNNVYTGGWTHLDNVDRYTAIDSNTLSPSPTTYIDLVNRLGVGRWEIVTNYALTLTDAPLWMRAAGSASVKLDIDLFAGTSVNYNVWATQVQSHARHEIAHSYCSVAGSSYITPWSWLNAPIAFTQLPSPSATTTLGAVINDIGQGKWMIPSIDFGKYSDLPPTRNDTSLFLEVEFGGGSLTLVKASQAFSSTQWTRTLSTGSVNWSSTTWVPLGGEFYSTTELPVGLWTDNSIIYKKTWTINVTNAAASASTWLNVGNVNTIFGGQVYLVRPLEYSNSSHFGWAEGGITGSNVQMYAPRPTWGTALATTITAWYRK